MKFSLLMPLSYYVITLNVALHSVHPVVALPLYTNSRWIVDKIGKRVKLVCINWSSHLEPMVAEGLSKQPLDDISNVILAMGFNCVRLTWPLNLVTDDSVASVTVLQSFQNLGLIEFIPGIKANSPSLLNLTLIQAFKEVVSSLGKNNLMIILDNHINKPGWCCSEDKDGFFGDRYFDPDIWVKGLTKMASMFNGTSNVVAMSLRNELRGPNQNVNDWYRYMQQGAEAVHLANPNILVILSGLNFATDLSFLKVQAVKLTFTRKLVYEVHWYSFYDSWPRNSSDQLCEKVVMNLMDKVGFVLSGWPLLLSEFGLDLTSNNISEGRYLTCLLFVAYELDLEWALWGLQGSYYVREGTHDANEPYGVLSFDWTKIRNSSFMEKLSSIKHPLQGPGIPPTPYNTIYHPLSGRCILNMKGSLRLGSCNDSKSWTYTTKNTITFKATNSCIQAVGVGKAPVLSKACSNPSSKWDVTSVLPMQLSSLVTNGTTICLDIDHNAIIITNQCKCLEGDPTCDPTSQWFKIAANIKSQSSCATPPTYVSIMVFNLLFLFLLYDIEFLQKK